jgi:hypothetical protein
VHEDDPSWQRIKATETSPDRIRSLFSPHDDIRDFLESRGIFIFFRWRVQDQDDLIDLIMLFKSQQAPFQHWSPFQRDMLFQGPETVPFSSGNDYDGGFFSHHSTSL